MYTTEEWKNQPSGTQAIRIQCYDGNTGNLISREYFSENEDDEIRDALQVADGYFTETHRVTHK